MKHRSGPQDHARRSVRPLSNHQHCDPSESESSDGDDDDIPAVVRRHPSSSPSKRLSIISPAHLHVNPLKRSPSDPARGDITVFSGSKKPRAGYNLAPDSAKLHPRFSQDEATVGTTSLAENPNLGTEDHVREGLLSSVNDAFRHIKARQSQAPIKRESDSVSLPLNGVKPADLGYGESMGTQAPDEYLLILPRATSATLILGEEVPDVSRISPGKLPAQDDDVLSVTPPSPIRVECGLGETNQAEVEVQTPVDVGQQNNNNDDVWKLSQSPEEISQQEVLRDITLHSNLKSQPVKKRVSTSELSTASKLSNPSRDRVADAGKRKVGKVRRPGSRLHAEPDNDVKRVTNLQKSMLPVSNEEAGSPRGFSLAPNGVNSVQLIQVEDSDQGSQEELARTSRHDNSELSRIKNVDEPRFTDSDDDGALSDSSDAFNTDWGNDTSSNQSAEDSFMRDVLSSSADISLHAEDDEIFEGPPDDDVITIYLDHQPLRQLCKLLGDASWAGVKGDWQWQRFDYQGAETEPARVLLPILTKLERLYQATPKAPKLKEQNRFLRKHAPMLRSYFLKIKMVVEHIRTQRLEIPGRNDTARNTDPRRRKRMTRDLVLYVMPMLVHVLASAWSLGGKTWIETSFTAATVELLQRALGWVRSLNHRLLRELKRCPLEEEPESRHEQRIWERRNARRKEIDPLIDNLGQIIAAAPDRLVKTEARRQERLRREEQLTIERKAAEEAGAALAAERKKRSLLSIHGIHYRLDSPTASFRPPLPPLVRSTKWSYEEKGILFRHIQNSYPACPDLNRIRWELNKTFTETVNMAENILEKILATVMKDSSVEERTAKVRRIMRTS
ncbi:hypothetical protein GGS21DRAFT_128018 [Xylaria nigripes]|nr:hypothetical protein GGS21DRAFT_128018 [Xylaria nigripes]